jgi:hypothetical protein
MWGSILFKIFGLGPKNLYNNVLPHFDKYLLNNLKQLDYLDFREAILKSTYGPGGQTILLGSKKHK